MTKENNSTKCVLPLPSPRSDFRTGLPGCGRFPSWLRFGGGCLCSSQLPRCPVFGEALCLITLLHLLHPMMKRWNRRGDKRAAGDITPAQHHNIHFQPMGGQRFDAVDQRMLHHPRVWPDITLFEIKRADCFYNQ